MTTPLTSAPTLRTERLILRGPLRSDLEPWTTWVTTSPRLAQMEERGDIRDAWDGFLTGIGHWHYHGYGFFVLTSHDNPAPLGRVGLLNHVLWSDVDLAWHLFDEAEGQGFATEAAMAVKIWAHSTIEPSRLVSYIDVENTRSQAVAKRLGASTDGTRAAHDAECEVWEHAA